ncbi:hypothetical protein HG531_006115 [Fusarium graminearum]|nr:hypothetical protein HG531_006115 [Fusarium graminearum]
MPGPGPPALPICRAFNNSSHRSRVHGLTSLEVKTDDVAIGVLVLEIRNCDKLAIASVGSQGLGNNEKSIGESLNTPLSLTLDSLAKGIALEVRSAGDLESTSSRNNRLVDDHVVDTSKTVSDGICHLGNSMGVGALDHKSNGLGVLDLLNEGVLLLSQSLLVDETSVTQNLLGQIIDTVLSNTATDKLETLHVSALGSSESQNVVLGEDVKRKGVDTLLVNDNKVLCSIVAAELLLEIDDLLKLGIDKATLTLNKLISLLSAGIGLCALLVNSKNGIDNIGGKLLGQGSVKLGGKRSTSDTEEEFSVNLLGELERVEELQRLVRFPKY